MTIKCLKCKCEGNITSGIIFSSCQCLTCNGTCVYCGVDKCFDCGDVFKLDANGDIPKFSCGNTCNHLKFSKKYAALRNLNLNVPIPPWERNLLHYSVSNLDVELTWDLLYRGVNPFAKDYLGISPIDIARSLNSSKFDFNPIKVAAVQRIYNMLPKLERCIIPDTSGLNQYLLKPTTSRSISDSTTSVYDASIPIRPAPANRSTTSADHIYCNSRVRDLIQSHLAVQSLSTQMKLIQVASSVDESKGENVDVINIDSKVVTCSALLLSGMQPFTPLTLTRLSSDVDICENIIESSLQDNDINDANGPIPPIALASTSQLQLWSHAELLNAIIHYIPDTIQESQGIVSSPKKPSGNTDSISLECCVCYTPLTVSEFAYSCPRLGCGANLCTTCLFQLVSITISSSLYAVPLIRCPGKCVQCIPTSKWMSGLREYTGLEDGINVADMIPHIDQESATGQLFFELRTIILETPNLFDNSDTIEDNVFRVTKNLCVTALEICSVFQGSLTDVIKMIVEDFNYFSSDESIAYDLIPEENIDFMVFDYLSNSNLITKNYNGIIDMNVDDKGNFLNQLFDSSIIWNMPNDQDSLQGALQNYCQWFMKLILFLQIYFRDILSEINSFCKGYFVWKEQPASILYRRYEMNANALLKMRCGSCHESVNLFFASHDGSYCITNIKQRENILEVLLKDSSNEKKISFLRIWLGYLQGRVTVNTFTDVLLETIINQADASGEISPGLRENMDTEKCLETIIMERVKEALLLITDIERRFTAQLNIFRSYPKIYTPCCKQEHCFMCKIYGHHADRTCEEVQSQEIGITAQYCPGCGVPTLKTEGCTHIVCVCGQHWHWHEENSDY